MFHDYDAKQKQWKRINRVIYSPWWRAAHNLIAHPMLTIYRPLGELLHDFTQEKMYKPNKKYKAVITDDD